MILSRNIFYCIALSLSTFGVEARNVTSLNFNWQFVDSEGKQTMVNIPHDYQIGQPWIAPDENEHADNTDMAANIKSRLSARAFKECTKGTYTKELTIDKSLKGRRILLDFEGIMLFGDIYLNGELIGSTDYGYLGFEIDITNKVKWNEPNTLKVVADTGAPNNSRWYTGGGIIRDVNLIDTNQDTYIARHGVWVTTPVVTADSACVEVNAEVFTKEQVKASVTIRDKDGKVVSQSENQLKVSPKQRLAEYQIASITIDKPLLWDCDNPNMYTAEVSIINQKGEVVDEFKRSFGVRSIEYSPEFGLKLNGKKVLLKGVANHHTLGAVGAAAYPRAIENHIKLFKAFGINHIRTSHNPYSEQFLDLCDRYGILVVDELYDKWLTQYAGGRREWTALWQENVPEFVKRDRNHPSVIMWSLGNELQTYTNLPFNDWGVTAYKLQKLLLTKYDNTRPVTVAMHPRGRSLWTDSIPAPLAIETDIASYNYRYMYFPGDSRRYPNMIFYQSEANLSGMGPNFFEPDNSKVVGLAYWGMIDYLGESMGWPAKGWTNGVFDISLQPKPRAYFLKSMFSDVPTVHVCVAGSMSGASSWNGVKMESKQLSDHWNYTKGEKLDITVFTNAQEVDLRINGRSVGRKSNPVEDPKHRNQLIWDNVEYEAGNIEAIAYNDGKKVASHKIKTAGRFSKLVTETDKEQWIADGEDLKYIRVKAVDASGTIVPSVSDKLTFEVEGDATIIAADNGDLTSNENYTAHERNLYNGTALVILRAGQSASNVTLKVKSDAKTATLKLTTEASQMSSN